MFKSKKRLFRKNFSLIELLIVIGIMGALAALILPAFSDSETAAKDTACDYNQAGTLRYLTMFHSANGVYPAGFHTGGQDADWASAVSTTGNTATYSYLAAGGSKTDASGSAGDLTACAAYNLLVASDTVPVTNYKDSLEAAGIVKLAYGGSTIKNLVTTDGQNTTTISVKKVKPVAFTHNDSDCTWSGGTGAYWTEAIDAATGLVKADGDPLTFRNVPLSHVAAVLDGTAAINDHTSQFRKDGEEDSIIVPLYVAPSIDWTTYYKDGPNTSKVSISLAGKCPWGEGGQARYYIAFFRVFEDKTPAQLLCTSCPDCGILDATTF